MIDTCCHFSRHYVPVVRSSNVDLPANGDLGAEGLSIIFSRENNKLPLSRALFGSSAVMETARKLAKTVFAPSMSS